MESALVSPGGNVIFAKWPQAAQNGLVGRVTYGPLVEE